MSNAAQYGKIEPHAPDEIGPRLDEHQIAGFGWRFGAGVVDYVALMFLPIWILPSDLAMLVDWSLLFANTGVMAGLTGRSLGKVLFGLRLVRPLDVRGRIGEVDAYPGVGLAIARYFAHVVDLIPFGLGFIRPAWNWLGRTFADSIMGTVVYRHHDDDLEHVRGRRAW